MDTIMVRAYSKQYIALRKSIIKKFDLDEWHIIRFQLPDIDDVIITGKIIKIKRRKNGETSYKLSIPKTFIEKHSIILPGNLKLRILKKRKIGFRPNIKRKRNYLDIVSLLDNKFTYFENKDRTVTIYFLNGFSHSEATLPRFLKINEFFLWNLGLYLAEGTKTN
ncbi:MAG: hypothetical protein KKC05_03825 [Nanoarchaeota archaeon]|nr:hypothetical protein [Nanoarchaeota archaeon]